MSILLGIIHYCTLNETRCGDTHPHRFLPSVLTLCAVSHQVHLAVSALAQFADVLIALMYVGGRERVDGQGLHVLDGDTAAAHRTRGGPPRTAPSRCRRQAHLGTVGQTENKEGWGHITAIKPSIIHIPRCGTEGFVPSCFAKLTNGTACSIINFHALLLPPPSTSFLCPLSSFLSLSFN